MRINFYFRKCIERYLRESFETIVIAWEVWPLKLEKEGTLMCKGLRFVRVPSPRSKGEHWVGLPLGIF